MSEERPEVERKIRALHGQQRLAEALTVAIDAYGTELLGYLVARVGDIDEARDVYAVACEDMWSGLAGFSWRSTFRTWAYAIARNASLRHFRSKKRARWSDESVPDMVAKARTATAPFLKTDIKDRVRVLRESLSVDERELLTLRIDRNLGWDEIALITSEVGSLTDEERRKQSARLRKQFERTKEKLRKLAEDTGLLTIDE